MLLSKSKMAVTLVFIVTATTGAWLIDHSVLAQRTGKPGQPEKQERGAEAPNKPKKALAVQGAVDFYGDPLPPGAIARIGTVRFRPGWWVNDLVFLPDGKGIISWDGWFSISLWDASSGLPLRHFKHEFGWVRSFAVTPDQKKLIVGTAKEGVFKLWDLTTGKGEEFGKHAKGISWIALSPDGKTLAASSWDNAIHVWDLATRNEVKVLKGPIIDPGFLAFSPDSRTIASGGQDGIIRLWNVAAGKETGQLNGHKGSIRLLTFAPDSKTLVSSGRSDETMRFWDLATSLETGQLAGKDADVWSVVFSPDGKLLALGGFVNQPGCPYAGRVSLVDLQTRKKIRQFAIKRWGTFALCFSPGGKRIASGGFDGVIRFWETATGKEIQAPEGNDGHLQQVSFGSDEKTVITGGQDGTVRFWDAATGKQLRRLEVRPEEMECCSLSPDGKLAATGNLSGKVHLWDLGTGREIRSLEAHSKAVSFLAISPNGKVLASAGQDNKVFIRDLPTGKELFQLPGTRSAASLAFSPSGKILASGSSADQTIGLWDSDTGKKIRAIACGANLYSPTFSPDGLTLVSSGPDGSLHLFDASNGNEKGRFSAQKNIRQLSITFSPDGKTLVTGGEDGTIRLWEIATLRERIRLDGHRSRTTTISYSKEGKRLLSANLDTTALIWDLNQAARGLNPNPPNPKDMEALWADLASNDAARAYRAIWDLASVSEQTTRLFDGCLHAIKEPDAKRINQLIQELDNASFEVREKAGKELEKLGESAGPVLRRALATKPSAEVAKRIDSLLEKLETRFLSSEELQVVRATEVLEILGNRDSLLLLDRLAKGAAGSRITQEAKASLDRLSKRTVPTKER